MKENWTYKPFLDCIESVKYTAKVQSKDYTKEGKYPIISQEDKYISGFWNNDEEVFRIPRPVVIFGDHTRVIKYVDFDFVLGADGVKILLPKENMLAKFMYYFLQWYKIPNLGYSRHFKLFKDISIPLPPLSEQESIVRELDLLNDLIAKKRAQVAEYNQLQQSLFYTMFGDPVTNEKGWEVKKLGEVGVGKLTYGSGASAVTFDGEIRYIRITDITDIGGLNDNLMSPNVYDERYLLNDGDILFARTGATVGKTYCHSKKNGRCIYAGYLIRLRPNKEIVEPLYVFHFTKSQYYLDFVSSSQRAVAQPNINAQQYGELKLPLPPLPLQQEFARKVEAIEALKEKVNASIKETETLLASRMDYYFG